MRRIVDDAKLPPLMVHTRDQVVKALGVGMIEKVDLVRNLKKDIKEAHRDGLDNKENILRQELKILNYDAHIRCNILMEQMYPKGIARCFNEYCKGRPDYAQLNPNGFKHKAQLIALHETSPKEVREDFFRAIREVPVASETLRKAYQPGVVEKLTMKLGVPTYDDDGLPVDYVII